MKASGLTITVTPCWCYGSETMDMDPLMPKAVWGFNGTERPGAVYLAAVLAGHNQKGLPAFSIYGHDVQDIGDTSIPADVQEKLLRFARAGLTAAQMRGKTYLSFGSVSMGIAGSIVNHDFFESYLGMKVMTCDMSEFTRRIERKIYDPQEFEKAIQWVRANCQEGKDYNPADRQKSRAEKDADWDFVVKMTMIARDVMVGNPRLAELGFGEEALGHNAILGGFPGPAPVDRSHAERRFHGSHVELFLRLERHPPAVYLRHRKRQPERHRFDALRPPADQHRPDLRRCAHLLEPGSGETRHRLQLRMDWPPAG